MPTLARFIMKTNLENKVILITGASGGIGAGVARGFAAENARLILHYHRQRAAVEKLQTELSDAKTFVECGRDRRRNRLNSVKPSRLPNCD